MGSANGVRTTGTASPCSWRTVPKAQPLRSACPCETNVAFRQLRHLGYLGFPGEATSKKRCLSSGAGRSRCHSASPKTVTCVVAVLLLLSLRRRPGLGCRRRSGRDRTSGRPGPVLLGVSGRSRCLGTGQNRATGLGRPTALYFPVKRGLASLQTRDLSGLIGGFLPEPSPDRAYWTHVRAGRALSYGLQ